MSSGSGAAAAAAGGCPVDHSKFTRTAAAQSPLLQAHAPATPAQLVCDSSALSSPPPFLPPSSAGGCPVDHSKFRPHAAAGVTAAGASSAAAAAHHGSGGVSVVGDLFPDSTRSSTQRLPLSTTPVASSIPRGGVAPEGAPPLTPDSTWVFPSPQRFYNAMQRKGWEPRERDMAWVVGIHNTVNEQTWKKVMEFERLHSSCSTPKLVRFRGRPADPSPKARVLGWLGYTAPFDRHDWVVDRCGREVRYVIDFYNGEGGNDMGGAALGMPPAIHLDVRPALDSPGALIDRVRMQCKSWFGSSGSSSNTGGQ